MFLLAIVKHLIIRVFYQLKEDVCTEFEMYFNHVLTKLIPIDISKARQNRDKFYEEVRLASKE
jgi:hypothetical protein